MSTAEQIHYENAEAWREKATRFEQQWREVLEAEHLMSNAYVQLRAMIPFALNTPDVSLLNNHYSNISVVDWTADCLREYVHEHDALETYPADMARETLGWE